MCVIAELYISRFQQASSLNVNSFVGVNQDVRNSRISEQRLKRSQPKHLVEHFLQTIAHEGKFNLHARVLAGANDHHKAECIVKALGRALCAATRIDERRAGQTPSTKGALG